MNYQHFYKMVNTIPNYDWGSKAIMHNLFYFQKNKVARLLNSVFGSFL